MIENLRKNGGEPPEYVYIGYITRMLERNETYIYNLGLLKNVRYIVCSRYRKKYNLNDVMREVRRYKIEPPPKNHPDAKLRPNEIVAKLDINGHTYLRMAKEKGWIREQTDEYGQYVTLADFDWFCRNYYIQALLPYAPERMKIGDVAELLGTSKNALERHLKAGTLTCGRDARNMRFFTKDDVRAFIDTPNGKKYFKFRKKPFGDYLRRCVAVMYMQHNGSWFDAKTDIHVINVERNEAGKTIGYSKEKLDKYYTHLWRYKEYGDTLPYYTRRHIRNKFGKTDLWIDTFIKGKCRNYVDKDKQLSPQEYAELVAERGEHLVNLITRGWVRDEVEQIVASGVDVKPKVELRKMKSEYNKTDKKVRRAIAKAAQAGMMKKYEPEIDPVELAFHTVMKRRELEHEEHKRQLCESYRKMVAERNVIRSALNLTPNYEPHLTAGTILKISDTPEVVFVLYSRLNHQKLFVKYAPFDTDCSFTVKDVGTVSNRKYQFTVYKSISRVANKVATLPPKTIPSWIVLAANSSIISDINFLKKLESVPMNYGAVGPFGYKQLLPDDSWIKSNETYGMYTIYDTDMASSRHMVGTLGYDSSNEVAVLDGPFIAVRGTHLGILQSLHKYKDFGDGQMFLSALLSFILRRLDVKLLQIPVDCSMISHDDIRVGSLEWNKAEESLRKLSKIPYRDLINK